jgi:hypothetical protein
MCSSLSTQIFQLETAFLKYKDRVITSLGNSANTDSLSKDKIITSLRNKADTDSLSKDKTIASLKDKVDTESQWAKTLGDTNIALQAELVAIRQEM